MTDTKVDESQDFEQMAIRKAKRLKLVDSADLATGAYPVKLPITAQIDDVRAKYADLEPTAETQDIVGVAGRVVFLRDAGKLNFVMLQSGTGERLQVMLNARELVKHDGVLDEDKVNGAGVELDDGGQSLKAFKRTVDLGDHLFAVGKVISSKTGELSVMASDWQLASKALRPLPVLHKELNEESRVRRRYVDLIARQDARDMVRTRAKVVKSLRKNFDDRGFLELETPMLQTIHGGAAARPFTTHINAFDIDLFLRIAPELYLKRAVVGGVEKVFEINRNFRNEGADSSHSPEFAMLEAYEAYGDYNSIGELTKNLIQQAALDTFGSLVVNFSDENGNTTEYSFEDSEWSDITMYGSLSLALAQNGAKIGGKPATDETNNNPVTPKTSVQELLELAKQAGLEKDVLGKDENGRPLPPPSHGKLVELLWEHYVGDYLYKPTFVRDFPVETSPLVRGHRTTAGLVEKWDLYVRGFELATGYSELVDPVIQRERLVAQSKAAAAGDDEAMPFDEDFLEALEYGMPPTGGMGMGLDRLLMALTGRGIRETITFPLVKPTV
ncbi:lysine--tRNA ligase [Actinomycetota bacterium]|nr:lysine--tRNA ligase [Actinomycetota bacterium]